MKKYILISIGIVIVFLFSIIIHQQDPMIKSGKEEKTIQDLKVFYGALEQIKKDLGYYPETIDGLQIIYENLNKEQNWGGPYLLRKVEIKDSWGRELIYKYPHSCSANLNMFVLYSAGKNGIDECLTGDDVYITEDDFKKYLEWLKSEDQS